MAYNSFLSLLPTSLRLNTYTIRAIIVSVTSSWPLKLSTKKLVKRGESVLSRSRVLMVEKRGVRKGGVLRARQAGLKEDKGGSVGVSKAKVSLRRGR